jgi:hypothetical protein
MRKLIFLLILCFSFSLIRCDLNNRKTKSEEILLSNFVTKKDRGKMYFEISQDNCDSLIFKTFKEIRDDLIPIEEWLSRIMFTTLDNIEVCKLNNLNIGVNKTVYFLKSCYEYCFCAIVLLTYDENGNIVSKIVLAELNDYVGGLIKIRSEIEKGRIIQTTINRSATDYDRIAKRSFTVTDSLIKEFNIMEDGGLHLQKSDSLRTVE